MQTIVITGGAGFIGSNLSEALLKQGEKVIIIDNFNDYYDPAYKKENIKEVQDMACTLKKPENVIVCEGDIRDATFIDDTFLKYKPDVIIHLAACAGVRPSIDDPKLYFDVNINGTLNILEGMKKHRIKRLCFASSSSVYGNNKKVPFSEIDTVDYPISPYAASKKSGELLCYTYHHLYKMSIACMRFFTVYGKRQRPDLAIYKFTKNILENKPIELYGDGKSRRDYTYIEDIVSGILKSLDFINSNENSYDIFNLGQSNTISLNEMLSTIEKALNKKAIIKNLPCQKGDVECTFAEIAHSKDVLGYAPKTDFTKGINEFIQWFITRRLNNQ